MAKERKKLCEKVYIVNGEDKRSASDQVERLEFRFTNGHVMTVVMSDVPAAIQTAAAYHGLAQKLGDTYAGADSVGEAADNAEAMWERLKLGEWTSERTAAGPRIADILAAIGRAKEEAGQPFDEESVRAKLLADETLRKGAPGNPAIAKHLAAIKAEKAATAAKEAAKVAKGTEADLASF